MPDSLKVSVLADGQLLLDGKPVTLALLGAAMEQGAKDKAVVWYYRESADGQPHPAALEVMKLIVSNRLPVRLSTQPDFSDTVTPTDPRLEAMFAAMRAKAAKRSIVILRPDGRHMALPAMEKSSLAADALSSIERILPASVKRNVAVIGDTAWSVVDRPSLQTVNQAIPFFGILMGFAAIGHAVWIFNPDTALALNAGARDADVLLVDDARVSALPPGWQETVALVMRSPQILVHDRATHQLRQP